jgi:RHS repeat-associated protein
MSLSFAPSVCFGQSEYGPFGEVIRATGPMAKANHFRFSTKYQDDETDLLYYGYRYSNGSTGRWLNRDPIGELGGINLYGYVGNDPINEIDLFGLVDCAALKAAIAHLTATAHGTLQSMSDINQMFESAKTSADASLAISFVFAVRSIVGLADDLAVNATKTAPVFTSAARGTIPAGVFTSSGRIALAGSDAFGSTMASSASARNVGALLIGAKEAGSEIGQDAPTRVSTTAQRILDPYGRLADVQNETGAEMSAATYETLKGVQDRLRDLKNQYNKNCCK